MLAAMEVGMPRKRNSSGRMTNTAAAMADPHKLRIPPMMTMERIKMDSSTVKLVCQLPQKSDRIKKDNNSYNN